MTYPTETEADRAQKLIQALWNDKEYGAGIRRKAKEFYPDIQTPEDSLEPVMNERIAPLKAENDELKARFEALSEKVAAREKAATEKETEEKLRSALEEARDRYSLTQDGFDKMVARMKETGNYQDAEAAAAWVASKTPPPAKAKPDWMPQAMNLFGSNERDESLALLHRNPEAYADAQIAEMLRDPDAYVRATFGA
jgi:ElaB/YqjD/DUF883 family membrane-anchored ribosome-binding protein